MNYWKLGGIAALCALIAFGAWHTKSKFDALAAQQVANAAQLETITAQNEALKKNQANTKTANEVSDDYEKKVAALYAPVAFGVSSASGAAGNSMPSLSIAASGSNAAASCNSGADRQAVKRALKKELLKLIALQTYNQKIALNMSK